MRKIVFPVLLIICAVTLTAGCNKMEREDDTGDYDPKICPFCCKELSSEEECLEHRLSCDPYLQDKSGPFMIPISFESDEEVDAAHWMSRLPGDTRLVNLTIPGLHDAATYSYTAKMTPTFIKDQNIDYHDAWNKGARAFDLRLGYDDRNLLKKRSFEDRCMFFHGDNFFGIMFGLCMMQNFRTDITKHFPTPEQLKGETMILITKNEFHPASVSRSKLNTFEYFMRLMIERYGKDVFIEYSPELTLKQCEGKIIIFTREKTYTEDYSRIGGIPSVPVSYISSFPDDGGTTIEVYRNGQCLHNYSAYVQDHYNVGKSGTGNDKYTIFRDALNHRKAKAPDAIFFNGMNAVQDKPSWDICEFMNDKIGSDLAKAKWESQYEQGMGVVLTDFYGVDNYKHGFLWTTRNFKGNNLAVQLVSHNFKRLRQLK